MIQDIIVKKRDGAPLTSGEIESFVAGCVDGTIPDYQAAALLMAIWFTGMNEDETAALTIALRDSGETVDLSPLGSATVDKHSTGGVSDSTSLVAVPLAAACGARVAKISGRGLGHTGGTVDKLEAVPGLCADRGVAELIDIASACGLAIIGQSASLVPADRKLYALRDVTGTIDSVSLIASSIMCKKLAAGAGAIVLDVKTGSGSFVGDVAAARELATLMTAIAVRAGRRCTALVTDMNQPLGTCVGNALEVAEAIETLRGERDGDLATVSQALAAEMVLLAGLAGEPGEAEMMVRRALDSGAGLERLAALLGKLGGDPAVCRDTSLLPRAAEEVAVTAAAAGFVTAMATARIGDCARLLGAGRQRQEDAVDPAVGLRLHARLGDRVETGGALATAFVNDASRVDTMIDRLRGAITIGPERVDPPPLIHGRIDG